MKEPYETILKLADELKEAVSLADNPRTEKDVETRVVGICENIMHALGLQFTLAKNIPGKRPKDGRIKSIAIVKRSVKEYLNSEGYTVTDMVKLPEFAPDNGDALCVYILVDEEMDAMVQKTLEAQLLEEFPEANMIVIVPLMMSEEEEEDCDD